jgi:hypothetical protein
MSFTALDTLNSLRLIDGMTGIAPVRVAPRVRTRLAGVLAIIFRDKARKKARVDTKTNACGVHAANAPQPRQVMGRGLTWRTTVVTKHSGETR